MAPVSWEAGPQYAAQPSNTEIKWWLRKRSVVINDARPDVLDSIALRLRSLVYFPKGWRVTVR